MKSKLAKYIALIILLIIAGACDDSFLEQDYIAGPSSDSFWKDAQQANEGLVGVYTVLNFEGQSIIGRMVLGSSAADDIAEDHGDFSRVGTGMIEVDKYTWNPSSRYINDHWYSSYKGIKRANDVIVNVPLIEAENATEQTLMDRYVAEAKTLRAWFYFNVVTAWGDVPLITEEITPAEVQELTRTPQAEVWAQIEQDLLESRSVLPASYDAADLGRVTSTFANALLSTVYLWTGEYQKSIDAANLVPVVALEPNYADLFNGVAENSPEKILDVMNASGIAGGGNGYFNTEKTKVNRFLLTGPVFSWSHFMQPDRNFLDNMFDANDARRGDDVIVDYNQGDIYDRNANGVIDSPGADDSPGDNAPHFAHSLKYVDKSIDISIGGNVWNGSGGTVNVIIMRFADVLLNLAEAYNELGQGANALAPLNTIRQRAGLADVTTTDQNELRDIILDERAKEFAWEGRRFFDLKRAGKLSEVLSPLGWQPHMTVFPIPQTEIDLTSMEQSPGF